MRDMRLAIRHEWMHTWCCPWPALWEVDPVASPLVGEPGSALLRAKFRYVVEQRLYQREPTSTGAVRPRDRIGEP